MDDGLCAVNADSFKEFSLHGFVWISRQAF
jgi:hypothetical protein